MPYEPGRALILSRLPAKDWFTLDEAATHAGWSHAFMRARVADGSLAVQEFQKPVECRAWGRGRHCSYRVHIDDLVLFILRHPSGRWNFSEEKPFRDVAMITRSWPKWMRRELIKTLERSLVA